LIFLPFWLFSNTIKSLDSTTFFQPMFSPE
jgi:hypothetical protein